MDGHALGLFLVDRLIDTLADLSEHQTMDPIALLHELQKEEDDLHKQILLSQLPVDLIFSPSDGTSRDPTLDLSVLWKGPSLCRTGRLPAQSRYLGYTTNTSKVGNIAVLGLEEYDTGISILDANKAHAANEGFMALTYQPGGIDRTTCSVPLKPDYKDFFYVHQMHGRAKLSVPNEKERLGYGYDSSQYKGLIILVFGDCEWGKCAKGEVRPEGFLEAKFEMAVNGAPVIELTDTGFNAWIVKGEDGFYWQADSNGIYDIAITVKKEGGFLKLSSVILY